MIDFPISDIAAACAGFNAEIDKTAEERLNIYGNMLIEWNEKVNLTAITDPSEITVKHFLDCAMLLKYADIKSGGSVIDVGTGAGFPGLVIKILRPDIKITLLDSLNKRLNFLSAVCGEIGLDCDIVHARAEDGAKNPVLREKFDFATARAVAKLNVLSEYCLPYVRVGGQFIAMKGRIEDSELDGAKKAVKLLGGGKTSVFAETLTGCEARCFVCVSKISQTPIKYPRISAKISKQPL